MAVSLSVSIPEQWDWREGGPSGGIGEEGGDPMLLASPALGISPGLKPPPLPALPFRPGRKIRVMGWGSIARHPPGSTQHGSGARAGGGSAC